MSVNRSQTWLRVETQRIKSAHRHFLLTQGLSLRAVPADTYSQHILRKAAADRVTNARDCTAWDDVGYKTNVQEQWNLIAKGFNNFISHDFCHEGFAAILPASAWPSSLVRQHLSVVSFLLLMRPREAWSIPLIIDISLVFFGKLGHG